MWLFKNKTAPEDKQILLNTLEAITNLAKSGNTNIEDTNKIYSRITKEYLILLSKGLFIEQFEPNVVYVSKITFIDKQTLEKPIEWVIKAKLEPALFYSRQTDEKFDGRFKCGKDEYVEYSPCEGYHVKLKINEVPDSFEFKFINTLTDRQWKMEILYKNIEVAVLQTQKLKKLYEDML